MKNLLRIIAALLLLAGLGSLAAYFLKSPGDGILTWDAPVVKKSLMTFAYKVYGNPAAQNGRNFLSKLVFRNKGAGPIHNFSISYQIPDYIPWTTPETQGDIPAGQTVVKLYYPQLPSKVTQLTSQTTVTLETKIQWTEKTGTPREEILRSNVELRGVNEVEYTDLAASEIVSWYDMFVTSPFTAAMVTPNDPVVKEFVAEITRRTGGTTANVAGGPAEVIRIMKAVYDYMCETGMRYTSDAGVPSKMGDVQTTVQTVRLPRDVIITNEGLCIELALLWSSVMEHLGSKTTVVFRPGHAFTLIWVGQGANDFIPIECTCITPMAVGRKGPVSFGDAVKMAQEDLQKQQFQIWVNVQQYQQQGFRPPELPAIEIDKIKNILAERRVTHAAVPAPNNGGGQPVAQNNGGGQPAPQDNAAEPENEAATNARPNTGGPQRPVANGYYRWVGANGFVSVDIPQQWTRVENTAIPGMIFIAQDAQSTVGVNVFQYFNVRTANDAMRTAQESFRVRAGVKLKVASQQQKNDLTIYSGSSISSTGNNKWVGVFRPTQAGVLGFFIGADQRQFGRNTKLIDYIISTAHVGAQ